jgi:hypothetical protein
MKVHHLRYKISFLTLLETEPMFSCSFDKVETES